MTDSSFSDTFCAHPGPLRVPCWAPGSHNLHDFCSRFPTFATNSTRVLPQIIGKLNASFAPTFTRVLHLLLREFCPYFYTSFGINYPPILPRVTNDFHHFRKISNDTASQTMPPMRTRVGTIIRMHRAEMGFPFSAEMGFPSSAEMGFPLVPFAAEMAST